MGHKLINLALQSENSFESLTNGEIAISFLHSVVLGALLSYLTYLVMSNKVLSEDSEKILKKKLQNITGAVNVLLLAVGLTGAMILIGHHLARALAIAATIGLIRFRVKLDGKNLGAIYLFSIIAGIGCGVQQFMVSYIVISLCLLIHLVLFFLIQKMK